MSEPMDLHGHKILITGASRGIGRACAELCAELGAKLVLVARNARALDELCAALPNGPHQAIPFELGETERIPELFKAITPGEKLTGLLHAAGVGPAIPIKMVSPADMRDTFAVNYFAFMTLVRQFIRPQFSCGGSIVAISSVAALAGWQGLSVYSGSKGALSASVRSLAVELAARHYRVNAVLPSNIRTDMLEAIMAGLSEEERLKIEQKQPLGFGEPRDVANAAAFLLSDAAKFITGTDLVVDGGYLAL